MRRYKLKDLLTIKNGSDYRHLSEGNIPVYGSGGLMCFVDRAMSSKSSILLPRKGTLDNIMFVDEPFWTVDTMYWSEVKENLVEPYYLYNYLKVLKFDGIRTGSTLPSMTSSAYYDIPINLPDYNEQKRVSNILKSLDKKIALNNKINQELEQMAKTLYDYWFVQFDFPDEKGRPYKSANGKMVYNETLKREIPVGWEVGTLRDICKITRGVSYDKKVVSDVYLNGFTPIFRANNIDNGHINYDSLVFVPNDLISNSQIIRKNDVIMTMSSGSLNHLGKTYKSKTDMNYSYGAFCSKITPSNDYRHYLSSFLSSLSFQIYIKNMCLGTNINNLNNEHIYSAPICIPNTSLLDRFNSITDTIFSMISKNEQENVELVEIRDFLLPLLMNGQVTVSSEY